jgi:ribosome-associated translation inhibitor RaiA
MRIEVISEQGAATPQVRAYAEYRFFATLARHARAIRTVRVLLRQRERTDASSRVTCAVRVALEPSGSTRARAHGPHALGAIDRAAERVGHLMNRRAAAPPVAP